MPHVSNLDGFRNFFSVANRYLPPDSVQCCLDLGSRDGEIAGYLADNYKSADVFAFECNPDAIALCRKNLANTRVQLVEKAVADVNGTLDFFSIDPEKTETPHEDGNIGASSLYRAREDYPHERYVQNKITVDAVRLESWAEAAGQSDIDVIWMDLQGAEIRALVGLGSRLSRVKLIYTEVQYKAIYENQPGAKELRDHLTKNDFVRVAAFNQFEYFGDELFCHRSLLPWWRRLIGR